VKIRSVKAIATAPAGSNLIVVKVETTEPVYMVWVVQRSLSRAEVVITAINSYLNDFCEGKILTILKIYGRGICKLYWRNGPVLNNR